MGHFENGAWVESSPIRAYQCWHKACECGHDAPIIKDGIPHCRWCRTPYNPGACINYRDVHFTKMVREPYIKEPIPLCEHDGNVGLPLDTDYTHPVKMESE